MKQISLITIVLVLFLTSCDSYKQVPYFQDLDRNSIIQENIKNFSPYTIQTNDILGIYFNSSSSQEAMAPFNTNLGRINGNIADMASNNPVVGYLVDEKGNIQIPLIGTMKVAGYTIADFQQQLTKALTTYLKDPVINIRIINFKVSVLGDVAKPDVYTFLTDNVTIPQALSSAGDLNITAKRTSVLLIREENGKRIYVPIDLTSKKLFESPYYYLKSNDILYVDPDRTKFATVDRGYRNAELAIGFTSVLALIFSIYINKK
jgi:polysaccharide export outer membrane protein